MRKHLEPFFGDCLIAEIEGQVLAPKELITMYGGSFRVRSPSQKSSSFTMCGLSS
jgi:hypothetical protein